MKHKTRALSVLILCFVLSGCIHGKTPLAQAFDDMEVLSNAFVSASQIVQDIHLAGFISDADWTGIILPVHDKGKLLIDAAWAALHAWSVAGADNIAAASRFAAALADAQTAYTDFQKLVDASKPGGAGLHPQPQTQPQTQPGVQ